MEKSLIVAKLKKACILFMSFTSFFDVGKIYLWSANHSATAVASSPDNNPPGIDP